MLFLVFAGTLAVRGGGIFLLFDINSIGGKRGKTFGDHNAVFEYFKTGAACGTGLIPWIEERPTVASSAASGAFTLNHINSKLIWLRYNITLLCVCQNHIQATTEKE